MILSPVRIYSAAWRVALVLLTAEIAAVSALRYLTGSEPGPPPVLANRFAHPFLLIHVIGGMTALLAGPAQFVRQLRARWPAVHRLTGRLYVAGCALAAPAGFMLALGTTAGPVAALGFAIPALLLPWFTWLGLRAAVEQRFNDHREWMLRSYGVISTAITLRLMLPAAGLLGLEFLPAYRLISWAAWITNLALVEMAIHRRREAVAAAPNVAPA